MYICMCVYMYLEFQVIALYHLGFFLVFFFLIYSPILFGLMAMDTALLQFDQEPESAQQAPQACSCFKADN